MDAKLHFKLARLLGFTLGDRGGAAPKISYILPKECIFTVQGRGGCACKHFGLKFACEMSVHGMHQHGQDVHEEANSEAASSGLSEASSDS